MTVSRIITLCAITFAFSLNVAVAAGQGVFNKRSISQHALTDWEAKKMAAEFKRLFNPSSSSGKQKLGRNPWEIKKEKQKRQNKKGGKVAQTWGHCREFSYKQRGQCYARGGNAYSCERYYDARVNYCNNNF